MEAIAVPYNHQIHLIFMNEPIKCERRLDALNMSLASESSSLVLVN